SRCRNRIMTEIAAPAIDPLDEVPSTATQLEDLQVLLSVARSMGAHRELDELLGTIVESARKVLHADRGTLFLYDDQTHELYSKIAQQAKEIRFPANKGIAGAA